MRIDLGSSQGLIVLALIIFCVWCVFRRRLQWLRFVLIAIVGIEVLYIIGQTSFNDIVPLRHIFKYDVFAAIGQLFPDTWFGESLTKFGTWLSNLLISPINFLMNLAMGR